MKINDFNWRFTVYVSAAVVMFAAIRLAELLAGG